MNTRTPWLGIVALSVLVSAIAGATTTQLFTDAKVLRFFAQASRPSQAVAGQATAYYAPDAGAIMLSMGSSADAGYVALAAGGGSGAVTGTSGKLAKFTSATAVGDSLVYVNTTGIGINQTTPTTPIQLGTGGAVTSSDSQFLATRALDDTGSGAAHTFSDCTSVTRSGSIGFNSFDARPTFTGTQGYNHYAGFQTLAIMDTTGTTANLYGYAFNPQVTHGTVTHASGAYMFNFNVAAPGVVTTYDGIYVEALTVGTNNYAMRTAGAQPVLLNTPAGAFGRLGQNLEVNTTNNYGGEALSTWSTTGAHGSLLEFNKSASATIGTQAAVSSGDLLGQITARGSDGSTFQNSAAILFSVDAASGSADMPGRISLWTSTDGTTTLTERMRVNNAGAIQALTAVTSKPACAADTNVGTWVVYSKSAGATISMCFCQKVSSSYLWAAIGTGDCT